MKTTQSVVLAIESSRSSGRAVLRGIADYAARNGRWAFSWETNGLKKGQPAFQGEKGLILHDVDEINGALAYGLPTVVIGHLPAEISGVVNVVTDCEAIGRMAAEHLMRCGFKRFAFCGCTTSSGADASWSLARHDSFRRRLAKAGVSITATSLPMNSGAWARRKEKTIAWLRGLTKPVGLFACNDDCARRILELCHLAELAVPKEIGVLGTDNDAIACELMHPPMSSIAVNFRRAGYEAARALDSLMRDKNRVPKRIVTDAMQVVARQSTDFGAVPDPHIRRALKFLRLNAHRVVTVRDVASSSGLSRRGLANAFRAHLGSTILEEIRSARTGQIARFLVETNLTMREISDTLGFPNFQHLSRYFRSVKSLSPTDFRLAHRRSAAAEFF